jgi:hypothetical protein
MALTRQQRTSLLLDKLRAEVAALEALGVVMVGNAGASVLLVKGTPMPEEAAGADLLAGSDGTALRAALTALGYAPEDWAGLAVWDAQARPLAPAVLRQAIAALDPDTLLLCDEAAVLAMREAFADELCAKERIEHAMLGEGQVVELLGMRTMALGGFAQALGDERRKQLMWYRLKQLPPLGEPY